MQYLTGYGHKDIVVMGGEISDKQISFSRYLECKKGFEKSGLEFDPDKNYIHYTLGGEHDYAPHNLIEGESVRRV